MSHKSTLKMKISDKQTLKNTLDAMGVKYEVATKENGLKTNSIYGVTVGVDILLKEDHKGKSMKAIGFKKNTDGSYEATGDFYEVRGAKTKDGEDLGQDSFKKAISKRYQYHKAVEQLESAGYFIDEDVQDFTSNELNFTMQAGY